MPRRPRRRTPPLERVTNLSKGFALAALLYGAALLARRLLTPTGSLREGWIIRFYLQIGEPAVTTAYPVALAVLLIGACSEIVWRGLVAELRSSTSALSSPARARGFRHPAGSDR